MKKDKETLEMEEKLKLKKSMSELSEFVTMSEQKKQELLAKAKEAKLKNDGSSYKLATVGLASVMSYKRQAEQMLLSLDIVSSLKDVSKMTTGFLACMGTMSAEMGKIAKNNNFAKVSQDFNKSMEAVKKQSDGLNEMIDNTSMSMDEMNIDVSDDIQREIDSLIDGQLSSEENALDRDIEARLGRLKNNDKVKN